MARSRFDPPDPEGHHDDLTIDELDGLTLAVPDDPRELEDDRAAWLAEERPTEPRPVHRDPAPAEPPPIDLTVSSARSTPSRRSRVTLTAAVLVIAMTVVAISGAVGAFFIPDGTPQPPAAPLATSSLPPGEVGGLLPDTSLEGVSGAVSARSLRPAVIALIPDQCADCTAWLTQVRSQSVAFGFDVTLVVGPDQADAGAALEGALDSVRVELLVDPTNAFTTAYEPTERTLILVRDDGIVTNVLRNPDTELRLEAALLPLSQNLLSDV